MGATRGMGGVSHTAESVGSVGSMESGGSMGSVVEYEASKKSTCSSFSLDRRATNQRRGVMLRISDPISGNGGYKPLQNPQT